MGLLAIDYALHGPINPSLLVVTDTNKPKLSYARRHYPSEPQTLIHYLDGMRPVAIRYWRSAAAMASTISSCLCQTNS